LSLILDINSDMKKNMLEEWDELLKEWDEYKQNRSSGFTPPTRAQVIEILEKYNELLKDEYQDSDLWDVISQTTDKFLLKYYPKI